MVNWAAPVGNNERWDVVNDLVELHVSATDNVGVASVHFYRWDAINGTFINIGDAYTSPYSFTLDCSLLNLDWNEVFAVAYDAAGNASDAKYMWLYRHAPQPDLAPFTPDGYDGPVVPASVAGTLTPNDLFAGQSTFFDWHFANFGWASAPGTFYVELWVDDIRYVRYPEPDYAAKQIGGFDDWSEIIASPGWHSVRLVVDPDNTVIESDETNNTWEGYFYWMPSAPIYEDMETGASGWTASGLWHLADGSSAYPNSTSGVSSWWYGQETTGNYNTGVANSGDLTSQVVYIPSDNHYYLRFKYWYETESKMAAWDQRWVQVSVDGGDFVDLMQLYDDNMRTWHNSPVIDLAGLGGHTLQTRFHFDSLDAAENAYRGWYIDDFKDFDGSATIL